MKKLTTLFILLTNTYIAAGEIDGKGLICKVYGNSIGYFFENSRAYEYKIIGGEKKLELKSSDIGKYYTNENSIYIDEIKIDRKSLKYSRFSSFRGQCEAFRDKKSFEENFNIDNLIKDNKI